MSDWDRIRIEGDGESGLGRLLRIYRNGVLIPGVTAVKLEADNDGVQTLTLTQYVILEKDEDVVDRATQALEEREAAWKTQLDSIDEAWPGAAGTTEHRPGEPESLIPDSLRPMLGLDERG